MAEGQGLMVLIDTTAWVDFFSGRLLPHVTALQAMIEDDEDLCICGVILTEVFQGLRSDADYRKTKEYFDSLILLPMRKVTFERSASLYRSLRKKGVTIRTPIDCMIASVAIEHDIPLLHNDRDFEQIANHSKLKLVKLNRPT